MLKLFLYKVETVNLLCGKCPFTTWKPIYAVLEFHAKLLYRRGWMMYLLTSFAILFGLGAITCILVWKLYFEQSGK